MREVVVRMSDEAYEVITKEMESPNRPLSVEKYVRDFILYDHLAMDEAGVPEL